MNFQRPLVPTLLRLGLAAACSFAILALLLQFVSGSHDAAERPRLINLLSATSLGGLGAFLVLHLCGIGVRALRYRLLLSAANEPLVPGFLPMMMVTGFRNMVVDMLPSRLGELGYVALLNRAYGVGAGACFSSLAVSTVFDFIALASLIALFIAGLLIASEVQGWLFGALIVAVIIAVIGLFTLRWMVPRITALLESLAGDNGVRRWIGKLAALGRSVDDALVATRAAGVTGQVFALSIVVRTLKYLSIYLLFMAVAGPSIPALAEVADSSVVAAIIGAEIGASLPIPTLMSFGSYEAGGTLVFGLLGIDQQAGLMSLLATHIWSQALDYSIGALCLVLVIWTIRRKPATDQSTASGAMKPSRWQWLGLGVVGSVALVSAFALALQFRSIQKMGSFTAPPRGESLIQTDPGAATALSEDLGRLGVSGRVVWSSNRGGNHDILGMDLETGEIRALTRHPHTETWPRLSADGQQLLFARSREPWVSQRNSVAWDVYLLDIETGEERRIAEQASYPIWIDDRTVGYLMEGERVMQHPLDRGEPSPLLVPGGASPVRSGVQITSPSYNPRRGSLAFTGRQSAIGMDTGHWGTALWQPEGNQLQGVLNGCQLTWTSDYASLFQVGSGGHMKNQIYRVDPDSATAEPLLDMPGEFSHEYWPRDDQRGEYLVFGASRGDHEHDTADYEIFLWQIGSAAEEAVRLTFHTGNDNWPDIYIE